ncbi:aldo/keto reductase [Sphingobium jiangsuense]|uniref:Aryl-alcohol dehydrogenase-like predicted oxidoreductase n=1 Tax=Sphingobium jiangsuense TaxID=870476 RepID=A0A7W6BEC5_9SPHN|nr:aldo/keto reductase [Sphingobium jiangsuense]MBB3925278.1 aryl-alcohol dehydrogenase-like predicted oxidoreductase [Sphingobium jiangsuense]GLS99213.1 aldo/keto reductase [Sphingobium jiangsuense]
MIDRRHLLATLALFPFAANRALAAAMPSPQALHTVPIPGAGVSVPAIGIGTSRRYNDPVGEEQLAALRATIARFVELGGSVIDTAPSYGRAEEVVGRLVAELGVRDKLFLATKVGAETREDGAAQIQASFRRLRTDKLDLIAVHNLRGVEQQLPVLRDLKSAGRIRALGITTSSAGQYADFEAVMRRHALDSIQIDYALDNRTAAERILPLAQDKGMAVMINLPFGRDRLFKATAGRPLPDWAKEIGATSWAQIFLKYVISHPSRPIAIPGTAQTRYADDNLGAARGPLPDAALRTRMERFIDGL